MKTLSSFNQTKIDSPHVSPIKLLKIEFDGLTLYLCDRVFGGSSPFIFDSQIYEPLVISWSTIDYGMVGLDGKDGSPSQMSVVIDNTISVGGEDRFTDLFSTYKPTYADVTVSEIFEDASASGDKVIRFKGTVEDPDMELEQVTLNLISMEISVMNKLSVEVCDEDNYPDSDPDDWGKIFPIVYGEAKRVPFLGVDAGSMTTLSADITNVQTFINVSDATKYPQGGGTIQIDFEEITYGYISGNQFVNCTRGANATDAEAHDAGATVAELQSTYLYIMGHAVKSIDTVYVINRNSDENVLQVGNYTLYTGQSGDEHASYPGKAVIQFNTIPSIAPQINLEIEDTIDVDDTIAVNDAIGVDDPDHGHGGDVYTIWHMEYGYQITGYTIDPSNASNGDIGNYAHMNHPGTEIEVQKVYTEEGPGTPSYYRVCFLIGFSDASIRARFTWNGTQVQSSISGTGIFKSSWIATSLTWAQINALVGSIEVLNAGSPAGVIFCNDAWIEIQHEEVTVDTANISKTGAATKGGEAAKIGTVTLVGNSVADTVIGGNVSADIQGWQADDSGDYGTEASLIQRPDYVFKHFLVNYAGLTIADNINETVYAASGSQYSSDQFYLSVVLTERPDMLSLLSAMAYQVRSFQFWEAGKHHLVALPTLPVTDKTIVEGRIDIGSIKVRYTPRAELLNTYTASYNKEWIGDFESKLESFRGVLTANSSTSIAIFGTLESATLELPYVRGTTQAQRILNWILDDHAFERLILEFSGGHYFSDLERGDVLEFDFDTGDVLDKRFLGLVVANSDQFIITDMKQSEDGSFFIQCYKIVSSTSNSGTFYPSQLNDDGYSIEPSDFYNTTMANIIGDYSGDPITSTTTTSSSTTTTTTA